MVTNIRLKKVFRYLRQRPADSAIYMYIHVYIYIWLLSTQYCYKDVCVDTRSITPREKC